MKPSLPWNARVRSLRDEEEKDPTKMKLSKILHGFKSSVTRIIRSTQNDYNFSWQKSYYDHIIQDEASLANIRDYIHQNPLKWELEKDRDHIGNIE
jgi:putative transposase